MPATRRTTHFCLYVFVLALEARAQDPVAKGIDEFHHGQYLAARNTLEQAVNQKPRDPHARTFLALARAATGSCDVALNDLSQSFTSSKDSDLRRLAGLALAQCHLARNRFDLALPVVLELEKQFP